MDARTARLALKRCLDVVGGAFGLLVSLPIIVVLAALIRLESPGSALFSQNRVGQRGRSFRFYKLRTMYRDTERLLAADAQLHALYVAHGFKLPPQLDCRITRLGRLLRVASLDELPQFWNVLRGDMSLVGPRPIVPGELVHYRGAEHLLLSARPGITGAWATCGRSQIGYPARADIELTYVREWTIRNDLAILGRTFVAVVRRVGAR